MLSPVNRLLTAKIEKFHVLDIPIDDHPCIMRTMWVREIWVLKAGTSGSVP